MNYLLLEKIESLRQELYIAAQNRMLFEPEVLEISQKIDSLLNLLLRSN